MSASAPSSSPTPDLAALLPPTVRVRPNRNRRTLLSLRHGGAEGGWTLSVHPLLAAQPGFAPVCAAWVAARGRGSHPQLPQMLQTAGQQLARLDPRPPAPYPVEATPIGWRLDLPCILHEIHAAWFSDLPRPVICWSRELGSRRVRSIRFGSYRRAVGRRAAEIRMHPRLNQPWIAGCFLRHVVFHELCHHRQACMPVRGEAMHGPRFRAWERAFPDHALALAWERWALPFLLAGTAPPSSDPCATPSSPPDSSQPPPLPPTPST